MSSVTGPGVKLQDRDIALLRGLFESRLLTLAHAATLYFDGKAEAAKKRLQKLKAAGLIAERPRRVYEPAVLFLTRQAFRVLFEGGHLSDFPRLSWHKLEDRARVSESTLRHELQVLDAKAAIVSAVAKTDQYRIAQFSTWPLLFQFHAFSPTGERVLVKPDGFLRIAEGDEFEHAFFLEVDRGTERHEILTDRAFCYRDFYRRGGLATRFHGSDWQKQGNVPFRVLLVVPSVERRNNAAQAMLAIAEPILQQVWLTTMPELTTDPLGPIWTCPRDYEATSHGTAYDTERARRHDGRGSLRTERDEVTEPDIKKRRLLEE